MYASYAASVKESPFTLYSQNSFSSDLKIGQPQKQVCLQQHNQQQHQKQHLQQQLQHRTVQHVQQQAAQQVYGTRPLVWCAVLTLTIAAALFAFTPASYPSQRWSSSVAGTQQPAFEGSTPTAAMIKCRVKQGTNGVSSLCDGNVAYADGVQQHITVWKQTANTAEAGMPADASLDDGSDSNPWAVAYGRHRRRQQHRKLVRFV